MYCTFKKNTIRWNLARTYEIFVLDRSRATTLEAIIKNMWLPTTH